MRRAQPRKALFRLGRILATPGALDVLRVSRQTPLEYLARHVVGDWGDLDEHDQQANESALVHGSRILSAYHTRSGVKLWIITEAVGEQGRASTTLLLPDEY